MTSCLCVQVCVCVCTSALSWESREVPRLCVCVRSWHGHYGLATPHKPPRARFVAESLLQDSSEDGELPEEPDIGRHLPPERVGERQLALGPDDRGSLGSTARGEVVLRSSLAPAEYGLVSGVRGRQGIGLGGQTSCVCELLYWLSLSYYGSLWGDSPAPRE